MPLFSTLPLVVNVESPSSIRKIEFANDRRALRYIDQLEANYEALPRIPITMVEQSSIMKPIIAYRGYGDILRIESSVLSLIPSKCGQLIPNTLVSCSVTISPIKDSPEIIRSLGEHANYFDLMGLDISILFQDAESFTICSYRYDRYIVPFNIKNRFVVVYNQATDQFELAIPRLCMSEETRNRLKLSAFERDHFYD